MFTVDLNGGNIKVEKKEVIDPPAGKSPITFTYAGVEITEYVSPGQIINKKKAYERYVARQQENA